MSIRRLLYLGGRSQLSDLIEKICKDHVHVNSVYYGAEDWCIKELLAEHDCVLINLMHPWDVQAIAQHVLEYDLPLIGVHTFDQERVVESYLKKGLRRYVPLFQLEEQLVSENFC